MPKSLKRLLVVVLGIALAVAGELLAFYVYSSYSQGGFINGFLGVTAFAGILFGNILIISFPGVFAEKMRKAAGKKNKGLGFLAGSAMFILGITPFIASIVVFYHFTGKYHDAQLKQFGVVKTVVIVSEIRGKNSRHDLCFRFRHTDGTIWEGMLDAWQYQVGDSA